MADVQEGAEPKMNMRWNICFIFLKREMSYIMEIYVNIEEKEVEMLNIGIFS